jgi:uncharacterized protein with FMN-binding domain
MPKRGGIALLLTAAALAFLLSFRTPDTATVSRPGQVAIVSGPAASGTPTASPTATPRPTSRKGPVATPRPTSGTADRATSSPKPAATALRDGTYTGDAVPIRWGNVQIQVAINGGRIASVTAVDMPYSDRRTQRITDVAEPILREQAIAIQSAQLDVISGATYTSEAYAQSLQSALDRAAGG